MPKIKVKCFVCSGKKTNSVGHRCTSCEGSGYEAEKMEKCDFCNGKGYRNGRRCNTCEGHGVKWWKS